MKNKTLFATMMLVFMIFFQSTGFVKTEARTEYFNRCDFTIEKFKDITIKQNFTFPPNDSGFVKIDNDISFTPAAVTFPNGCLHLLGRQIDMSTLFKKKKLRTVGADFALEKYSIYNISNDRKYYILYFTDNSWSSSIGENNLMIVIEKNTFFSHIYTLGYTPCGNGNNLLYTNDALTFITLENKKLVLYSLSKGIKKKVDEYKIIELENQGCGLYFFNA